MYRKLLVVVIGILAVSLVGCGGGGGGGGPIILPPPGNGNGGDGNGVDVDQLVEDSIDALQDGNGALAATGFEQALAADPNNADANFGVAFVELMREANSLVQFLSAQNDAVFRNVTMLAVQPLLSPVPEQQGMLNLNRFMSQDDNGVEVDDMSLEEIRLEVVRLVDALESIGSYMDRVIKYGGDEWSFTVPEDWNDPDAGDITIWCRDVQVLAAALKFTIGILHFSAAYSGGSLGLAEDEWGYIEITGLTGEPVDPVDTNEDCFIDFAEIADAAALPADALVLAVDGREHLSAFVASWHRSFELLRDAINSYVAADALVGHWAFDMTREDSDSFVEKWNSYGSDYLNDLIGTWTSNGATLRVRAGLLDENPNLEDNPGLDFEVEASFAAFFSNLPDDFRGFPVRFICVEDEWGDIQYELPSQVNQAFTDDTLLGLFPDGLTQEQYDTIFGRDT